MDDKKVIIEAINWIKKKAPYAMKEALSADVNKAGVIPICKNGDNPQILLIKPRTKKKHLGPPPWQLVKGTRMINLKNGVLEDYEPKSRRHQEGDLEPLMCTALREGVEESGLILSNIAKSSPLGLHQFRSASTGKKRKMQLYALTVKDCHHFDWPGDKHKATEQMLWFSIDLLPTDIREDAKEIIQKLKPKLKKLL